MPEIDEYFNLATSNFSIAEERFKETEDALLTCKKRLGDCLERMRKLPYPYIDRNQLPQDQKLYSVNP